MKKILLMILMISTSAFASSLSLSGYLKVQDALASDDFKAANSAHQELCTKDGKAISSAYKDCNKSFKDIGDLRTSFKILSEFYIKTIAASELKGVIKATCPMANARWLQKDGSLRNPYYGSSMLDCGEKI